MSTGIGCAYPGCSKPVVGQCSGYQGSCGMFYCAEHSAGKLCWDCAERRQDDERRRLEEEATRRIHDEYRQDATEIKKRMKQYGCGRVLLIFAVPVVCVAFGVLMADSAKNSLWGVAGGAIGVIAFVILWRVYLEREDRLTKTLVMEMDAKKPGFAEFYKAYSAERLEDTWRLAATIAVGIVALGALAAGGEGATDGEELRGELEILRKKVDDLERRQ